MLFLIQCGSVALFFGAYWGLKANVSELKNEIRLLEQRLAVTEQNVKGHAQVTTPSAQLAVPVEPIQLGKAPTQPHPAGKPTSSSDAAVTSPPTKSVAEAVADTLVCVDKNTHAIVPCERAASCLGLKSFDTAYFNGLKTKLGISSPMMICNMKAVEGENPGPSEGVGQ
jgi:hypothetical protein